MRAVTFCDWGLIPYRIAWEQQEHLFAEALNCKKQDASANPMILPQHQLIFCQHPHVYTIGKSGSIHNLLVNDAFLESINATVVLSNRGGDITYHGPGQLVGYPIFDLEQLGLYIKDYVHLLEESVISLLSTYGIASSRMQGATGVWLDAGTTKARKICAIGVRASRYITMHGFALNVNTDLKYFSYINPCGFVDKGVTSLQKELDTTLDFNEVQMRMKQQMASTFEINYR